MTNFNSRPRVGGDMLLQSFMILGNISIHAPVWGATVEPAPQLVHIGISIHAPVWGATTGCPPHPPPDDFNSRPRVGGDRGALLQDDPGWNFNSRPRVGGDAVTADYVLGVTFISIHAPVWGATISLNNQVLDIKISIHAPVWGRPAGVSIVCEVINFNSRPRVGGDSKFIQK